MFDFARFNYISVIAEDGRVDAVINQGVVPRRGVDMTALTRSEHTSYCPYKGEASYYSISAGGDRSVDAVWTYETPFEAVAQMKDYVAFYPEWLAPATHHQSTTPVHLKLVHLQE